MNICIYPVLFTGLVEIIPGKFDHAWVVYRCLNHYDVEPFDFKIQLGYNVCRYRLKDTPEMTSSYVNCCCIFKR